MTQEEQIRLYRLMEKLNWFFHQEMHYLTTWTGIRRKRPHESVTRRFGILHTTFYGTTCPKRCRSSLRTRSAPNDFTLAQEVELQCP